MPVLGRRQANNEEYFPGYVTCLRNSPPRWKIYYFGMNRLGTRLSSKSSSSRLTRADLCWLHWFVTLIFLYCLIFFLLYNREKAGWESEYNHHNRLRASFHLWENRPSGVLRAYSVKTASYISLCSFFLWPYCLPRTLSLLGMLACCCSPGSFSLGGRTYRL